MTVRFFVRLVDLSFFLAKERTKNVAKSVELAKEAVAQDIKDGESWCKLELKSFWLRE